MLTNLMTPVSSIVTNVYFTLVAEAACPELDTTRNGKPDTVINPLFFNTKESQNELEVLGYKPKVL